MSSGVYEICLICGYYQPLLKLSIFPNMKLWLAFVFEKSEAMTKQKLGANNKLINGAFRAARIEPYILLKVISNKFHK